MLGKHCDGGFAEYIAVPARNAVPLPEEVSFEEGAVLMCSSATSFHALRKADLKPGETVAVFGAGGLGLSAIQLAQAFGAWEVYAVDISDKKLQIARSYGAIPVDASRRDPVAAIYALTDGRGADVALEVIGLRQTMEQAVRSLAVLGRAVMVGLAEGSFEIASYSDLLGKEAQVIGASDHLLWELPILTQFVRKGVLDLSQVITQTVPLEAGPINEALDGLERFEGAVRTVILP
jgi:2-desacetyl-2-hydroxyethyl bacteriochlorophyllide A dehydrogenase